MIDVAALRLWKLPGPWKTHPSLPPPCVSHRPLDGASGPDHSYHRLYDDGKRLIKR